MPYISIRQNGAELGWRELDGAVVIGRQKECDIPLIDMLMSRNHCRIEPTEAGDGWVLVDLESKNGTWHDETQIERMELTPGTRVRVGRTTITFHPGTPPAEGRYVSKASSRPSDPHEALAGTVMGMVVVDDGPAERPADPWAARRAARPRPTPRPLGAGESGVFPALTSVELSVPVHEPSSGACAAAREARVMDEARFIPDLSEALSVREPTTTTTTMMNTPMSGRGRALPRPMLLELQVAAEQEQRTTASAREADEEEAARATIIPDRAGRRWRARRPLSQEAVIILLAFGLLAFFRFAIDTSNPDVAVGQTPHVEEEPTFDVGVMAATPADLPPLSVTVTPAAVAEPAVPTPVEAVAAATDDVSPIKALALSAKELGRSLRWESLRGVVKDYQREVRRFILDAPLLTQAASPTATMSSDDH